MAHESPIERDVLARKKNPDCCNNAEPLVVTIEAKTKNKYSYDAKHYRLDRARFKLERKAYSVSYWTMIFLIAYTGLTLIIALASICSARAARMASETALRQLEGTEAASIIINDIEPVFESWRVVIFNAGKVAAPKVEIRYRVVHQSFPDERAIEKSEEVSVERGEVRPTDIQRAEPKITFDFQPRGYSERLSALVDAKEAFRIEGVISYNNGFDRTIEEPLCWETYPFAMPNPTKVEWQPCDMARSLLLERTRSLRLVAPPK